MKKAGSLASRLTRTAIVWMACVWLIVALCTTAYVSFQINHNFDDELIEISHRMADIAIHDLDARQPADQPLIASPPLFPNDAVIYHLVDDQQRILLRSEESPEQGFATPLHTGFTNIGPWRIYTVKHPSRPLYLQLADPLEERRDAVQKTLTGLLFAMCAVLPLAALVLRQLARRELRSVGLLESQIAVRGGADLRPLELDSLPEELRSVGSHVNHLLHRLDRALHVEKALATNAAHELRTPLASVRLRLQTAVDGGLQSKEVHAALESLTKLSRRTEKLLELSRAESGAILQGSQVHLAELVATVVQEFWHDPDIRARLQLHISEHALAPVQGDIDTLAIAVRNLVENALRHSGGAMVSVTLAPPCVIYVRDQGPGVTPDKLREIASRHVRHSSNAAGYGLGLSIVQTIALQHRAELKLSSPAPGSTAGFEASLALGAA